MKKIKEIANILLLMTIVLKIMMSVSAMCIASAGLTYNISIKGVDSANHTYEAYQVFAGDFADDTLSNIEWGNGIDTTKTIGTYTSIFDALATIVDNSSTPLIYPFMDENGDSMKTAANVASALENYANDDEIIREFADVISQYLTTDVDNYASTIDYIEENYDGVLSYSYTISGVEAGYYFVKDKDNSVESTSAYTDYILKVADNTAIVVKSTVPELDKVIASDSQKVYLNGTETNNISIGDTITYELRSYVPDTDAYNSYYYIIHDTMAKGLTFDTSSVKIKVGEVMLECKSENGIAITSAPSTDYTYELTYSIDSVTGETEIKIVFNNFKLYTETEDIVVTYDAMLNEEAVVGAKGNENTVYLEYSNNPNYDYNGDSPDPDNDEPTGVLPEEKTITYVSGIKLIKVDNGAPEKALTGAEFTITGKTLNKVIAIKTVYVQDDTDGTYYQLTDGTYTTDVPNQNTESNYVSTSTMYKPTIVATVENRTSDNGLYSVTSYVDEDGYLILNGLSEGTYTITETVTPQGYNTISPIEMTIGWTEPTTGEEECTWTATATHVADVMYPNSEGVFEVKIINVKGSVLPSTGGIGTTIFYVIGAILIFGAMVLLVTRKRMRRG